MAQLGRAPGSGPGGRGFKSHQPDKIILNATGVVYGTCRASSIGSPSEHKQFVTEAPLESPPTALRSKVICAIRDEIR